jgi:hypothetical protein
MKGDPLPEKDHVSRYCSAVHCTENGRITGTAFQLRQKDGYLSVNWLEFLQLYNRKNEIREIRKVLGSKLALGAKALIAVLNVGEIIEYVRSNSPDARKLIVLHEPEENDLSHSGVYGYDYGDILIAELIAEMVQELYPAKEPE